MSNSPLARVVPLMVAAGGLGYLAQLVGIPAWLAVIVVLVLADPVIRRWQRSWKPSHGEDASPPSRVTVIVAFAISATAALVASWVEHSTSRVLVSVSVAAFLVGVLLLAFTLWTGKARTRGPGRG
jgi:hypothetical protein